MAVALLAVAVAVLAAGALAAIEWRERHERVWQCVRLQFGRDVTPESLLTVLESVAGLPADRFIALDVEADHEGIAHYLSADRATMDSMRGALRAVLPSLRLVDLVGAEERSFASFRYGRVLRLRGKPGVLRTDGITEANAGLLAAMQPLGSKERLLLRWLIRPGRPVSVPNFVQSQYVLPGAPQGHSVDTESQRRLRIKNEAGVVRARGLIAVGTSERKRAWHLQARLLAALRTRLVRWFAHLPVRALYLVIATESENWRRCWRGL
jgi:hypothetical protein